ncbi:TSUP family transporter [Natribaculum luteum]|uniref:Probable membrane transporter protein n=1 Tax=Natribaculum luteum TaxID=1586232 RepID=A0ABD5P2M2_9EURY|nr:sulfite exporter TauE/SafE family protein [Natribaculum luteum]
MELGALAFAGVEVTAVGVLIAIAVLLLGGFVKGTVGFAVGLITIAGIVQVFPPQLALVALSIPFLVSNVVVLVNDGLPIEFLRTQIGFLITLTVGLFVGVWLLEALSAQLLYLFIAAYVGLFLVFQHVEEKIYEYAERPSVSVFAGTLSGLLGGAVGAPGPPLVIHSYLNTIDENRTVFVTGTSALFLVAHVVRVVFLANANLLQTTEFVLGALFTVPVFVGVYLGTVFRPYLDERLFALFIKLLLVLIGIRLFLNGIGW